MRKRYWALLAIGCVAAGLWAENTSRFAQGSEKPLLIAHRGLGQIFSRDDLRGDTCTAERLLLPEHPYFENTIAGFEAAFRAGAEIVEFDVQPTTDGHFVVFHDWALDCRTNGTGVTREHDLQSLKALDIGYGYTADGGKTFPFRGKGIGLMPTIDEVLATFPDRRFLINIKSDDPREGTLLAATLAQLAPEQRARLMVYGGGTAIDAFRRTLPDIRVLRTEGVIGCLLRYAGLGWSGHVPAACANTLFMVPANYAPYVWGYPDRLAARLKAHGSSLVVLGNDDGSGFSTGVDDAAAFAQLPSRFDGAIWTNRIDRIGPLRDAAP